MDLRPLYETLFLKCYSGIEILINDFPVSTLMKYLFSVFVPDERINSSDCSQTLGGEIVNDTTCKKKKEAKRYICWFGFILMAHGHALMHQRGKFIIAQINILVL